MHTINTDHPTEGYFPLGELATLRRSNEILYIYLHEDTLYHVLKTPAIPFVAGGVQYLLDEPGYRVRQLELPLKSLAWIVDMIETGLWNEKNGIKAILPSPKRILIEGEKLRICFISNYGTEGAKGVTIENFSRRGKYLDWQEMGFTHKTLLQAGLLELWKKIVWQCGSNHSLTNCQTENRMT